MAAAPFDARPLTEPVDRAAVRAHTRNLRALGQVPTNRNVFLIVVIVFMAVVFANVFGSVIVAVFAAVFGALGEGQWSFVPFLALVPVIFVIAVFVAVGVFVFRRMLGSGEKWYRLDRFARANGMSYRPVLASPPLPGMIFGQGHSRQALDMVRGDRPRFVEFANYRYTTGSGKNSTTHVWGYVAVKLDVPLPHIVLDATSNNTLFGSNLPSTFDRAQRLSLEGDFDRYFALYCPRGYERDALYLFTPDIMARFIDNAAALDVEIVDDWLFLYAKRDFSTLDPAMWAWLFSVVGALLDKLEQWARWRDERLRADAAAAARSAAASAPLAAAGVDPVPGGHAAVPFETPLAALRPPPGVAAPGRRLRKGVPWVVTIIFGGIIAFWIFTQFGGFALLFGGLFGGFSP
ncbi:hypothetical protein [Microbacterium thalassium]|uniref:DUF3137 domain-containing protein n=1 Tax=Microbacterium thalassium TaxID=362649 RepID=A0A7X0FMQ6_9MICO|nr:hypothetical protein [Microbacterium thalassium]MBB6390324.1 hypothetical protein [Microbacterium thalassium]GLK25433.1 hypothetical protein GCM10017607_27520 [Microbacterium thalassium]